MENEKKDSGNQSFINKPVDVNKLIGILGMFFLVFITFMFSNLVFAFSSSGGIVGSIFGVLNGLVLPLVGGVYWYKGNYSNKNPEFFKKNTKIGLRLLLLPWILLIPLSILLQILGN